MHTPVPALEALAAPAPLTLGQVALLDLYKCPILDGEIDDLNATAFALYLLSMPLEDAVHAAHFPERAIAWVDGIGVEGYNSRLVDALGAIKAFYHMLPKPESGEDGDEGDLKKNSASGGAATETSPKSSRSSAAPTGGRFATFFRRFLPSRWRSSTAASPRASRV